MKHFNMRAGAPARSQGLFDQTAEQRAVSGFGSRVLLKMDRPAPQIEPFLMADNEHFRMETPSERIERLNQRLYTERDQPQLAGLDDSELGLIGPYFAVIKMKLGLREDSASFPGKI